MRTHVLLLECDRVQFWNLILVGVCFGGFLSLVPGRTGLLRQLYLATCPTSTWQRKIVPKPRTYVVHPYENFFGIKYGLGVTNCETVIIPCLPRFF